MNRNRLIVAVAAAVVLVVGLFLGLRHSPSGRAKRQYNVLLITLDTTRVDHLGCYGYAAAVTPALDGLAAEGVAFEQAISNVPLTLPSHTTILTGLLPPEHGLRVNAGRKLDISQPTLAEVLQARGYQTGAFIAAVVLDKSNGLNRGFDVYSDQVAEEYKKFVNEPLSAYRPGNEVADDALGWLEKRDRSKPFFCWAHFYDPHKPYFGHRELAGTRYAEQATYDGEIAFMDIQVGRLLAFLRKEGLRENTLVIAVGDHGEGLGDHGEQTHGFMLFDATLRVPMIVSLPGRIQQGARVKSTVSLTDLFGTTLDVIGGGEVEERSGRSLAAALFGREVGSATVYSETNEPFAEFNWSPLRSLTTPQWKYIRSARRRMYDRQADPKELNNLVNSQPAERDELEKKLKAVESELQVHHAEEVELTAETVRRLEALGYLAGGHSDTDAENVDYSALHDIEEMIPVLDMLPELMALGRDGKTSEQLIKGLQEVIRLSPESFSFHGRLVDALVKAGRVQEALPEALEYHRLKPGDPDMCQTVATSYIYLGRPAEAVPYFWKAISLKADFALPHEELAKLLRASGDSEGADRHSADNRGKLGPASEQYELGVVLGSRQRFDEAVERFNEALKVAPGDALIHTGLARVLEQKGDYAEAAREYAEAVRLDPADPQKLGDWGKVLGKAGKYAEAAEHLTKFVELKPDDVPARTNLALVLARQGKLDEAMRHFAEALRVAPNDGQVHLTKAGVLQENGRLPEAVAEYREAVRLSPERPAWANHLSRILATSADATIRDGAEAVKLAEMACAGAGAKNASYLDTLACAYAEAGRFEEAVATAQKALAAAGDAGKPELAAEIRQRLGLYRNARAYHAEPN